MIIHYLLELWKKLNTRRRNPEQLSRDILDKAKELSNGKVMDDMTVVVSKLYSLY